MGELFGMQVRFTALPGQGDAFASILLEAARGLEDVDACLVYLVSRDPEEPDHVWVTEAWSDQRSHAASLEDPGTRALIERALPLLAGPPEALHLRPIGGTWTSR